MIHTCAARFDVTANLENFLLFFWTKQGPSYPLRAAHSLCSAEHSTVLLHASTSRNWWSSTETLSLSLSPAGSAASMHACPALRRIAQSCYCAVGKRHSKLSSRHSLYLVSPTAIDRFFVPGDAATCQPAARRHSLAVAVAGLHPPSSASCHWLVTRDLFSSPWKQKSFQDFPSHRIL